MSEGSPKDSVSDVLQDILAEVRAASKVQSEQAGILGEQSKSLARMEKDIGRLTKAIYGNGDQGLKLQVASLEGRVALAEKENSSHASWIKHHDTHTVSTGRFKVSTTVSIVAVVLSFLTAAAALIVSIVMKS